MVYDIVVPRILFWDHSHMRSYEWGMSVGSHSGTMHSHPTHINPHHIKVQEPGMQVRCCPQKTWESVNFEKKASITWGPSFAKLKMFKSSYIV